MTAKPYQLSRDPIFFTMAAIFAVLTTALPAVLGQPRFLPIAQAVALTLFLAVPLRQSDRRGAFGVVFGWLGLAMLTLLVLTWLLPLQMERAFDDGFLHRAAVSEWYYANYPLPASFGTQLLPSLIEIVGVTLGSLLTGGVVGAWFLLKVANLAAFSAGALLLTLGSPLLLPIALPVWSVLQVVGGGGLLVLLAEPLVCGHFGAGIANLAGARRRPLLIFSAVYGLGLLLELLLPSFWHFTG